MPSKYLAVVAFVILCAACGGDAGAGTPMEMASDPAVAASEGGMDRTADSRGVSLGAGSSLSAAPSGRDLWKGFSGLCGGDGH